MAIRARKSPKSSYKVPRRLKVPISFLGTGGSIETESSFQDQVQKRFALTCIITLFSGFALGIVFGQVTGPIGGFPYSTGSEPMIVAESAPAPSWEAQEDRSSSSSFGKTTHTEVRSSLRLAKAGFAYDLSGLRPGLDELPTPATLDLGQGTLEGAMAAPLGTRPLIAIVIDDLGLSTELTERAINLPANVTLSFLPYGLASKKLSAKARARGHEVMLHLPMEPDGPSDAGPHALEIFDTAGELQADLQWSLDQFDGYIGINNHMGSRFTEAREPMDQVMAELSKRNLLFLDSLTSSESVGRRSAHDHDVPFVARDVFLDNDTNKLSILAQFQALEELAITQGAAVAIGHPYDVTFEVLEPWLRSAQGRGFEVVSITDIYHYQEKKRGKAFKVASN